MWENSILAEALGWAGDKEGSAGTLMLGCEEGRRKAGYADTCSDGVRNVAMPPEFLVSIR